MDTMYKGILTAAALIGLLGGAYYYTNRNGDMNGAYDSSGLSASSTAQTGNGDAVKVSQDNSQKITMDDSTDPKVTLKTNLGDIVLELFAKDAPKTVANFLKLSKSGFYDATKFHRAIPNFMIQGGDPNSKDDDWSNDGMGGPGYQFADELNPDTASYKKGYARGTLAMANSGPDTNGSQFFIMHQDYALPHLYTIFGRVLSGIEVVDAIEKLPTNQNDHPTKDATVKSATVD